MSKSSGTPLRSAAPGSWWLRGTCLEPVWPVLRRCKDKQPVPSLSLPQALELLWWKFLQCIKIWTRHHIRPPVLSSHAVVGRSERFLTATHLFKGSCESTWASFHNSSSNTLPIPVFSAFKGMRDAPVLHYLTMK